MRVFIFSFIVLVVFYKYSVGPSPRKASFLYEGRTVSPTKNGPFLVEENNELFNVLIYRGLSNIENVFYF